MKWIKRIIRIIRHNIYQRNANISFRRWHRKKINGNIAVQLEEWENGYKMYSKPMEIFSGSTATPNYWAGFIPHSCAKRADGDYVVVKPEFLNVKFEDCTFGEETTWKEQRSPIK